MEEQVERLANINETIRRNLTLQKSRNSTLVQEKADLEAEIKALSQHFSAGKRITEINVTENSEIEYKKLSETEDKTDKEEDGKPRKKDPNRPRFTLKELQRVLKERNELKEKVITLGEDLDFYKKRWYVKKLV